MNIIKKIRYIYGWLFVRPRRWFFWKMMASSFEARWWFKKEDYFGWKYPNIHWWILYKTVFKFFKWLNYDAWRVFCDWTGGYRRTYPLVSRIIHRIGQTTAGFAIGGNECFHCGSEEGCPVELSADETGKNFILEGTESVGTQDGTDHRFWGITICPKCGYKDSYEDGSL